MDKEIKKLQKEVGFDTLSELLWWVRWLDVQLTSNDKLQPIAEKVGDGLRDIITKQPKI